MRFDIAKYDHQEWVLGDLAVDTDLEKYNDIHADILNGFIKVVFTRHDKYTTL